MRPNTRLTRPCICILAALAGLPGALADYEHVLPPEHVVLPPSRTPAESLAVIKVPGDLRVELVASEPMVRSPIDVSWSPDGRMWVVEMADYPAGIDGHGKPGGRIRILESTKGDGNYDKSTLFADGLPFPTTVKPWRNGALVVSGPNILYLEDTQHSGHADKIEKLFTGLREGNPQHRANGLQWGMDGWLYLANGNSGGTLRSPRTGQVLELGERDFRIRPDDGSIDLVSGETQFGRNRNDWDDWFGCNNTNPVLHYALDDHYLRRNPHLAPPDFVVTVPEIPGAALVYGISPPMARMNDPEGANHFTSACGVMIYRDDLLGPEYAGNVFTCEPVHNLVHREVISSRGVTFTSRRAPTEQASEFFASADDWSRFTTARLGPDGALYICDMYRLVIEHPEWIPDQWQKLLGNLRAGENMGRIYRVAPRSGSLRPIARLDQADGAGLAAAMSSPNGTVRDLAQQELVWRGDKSAAPALAALVTDSPRPETRCQALCSLDTLGALQPELLARALGDPHPGVRRQAVRLTEPFSGSHPELLAILVKLVDDPDPFVRQQLAYTLGEWKEDAAGDALARLVRQNTDPFILAAAMSSALPHAHALLAQIGAGGGANSTLIDIAISTQNLPALADLLRAICAPRNPADPPEQFRAMLQLLDGLNRNASSLDALTSAGDPGLSAALAEADSLFEAARTLAGAPDAPLAQRIAAAGVLGRGRGKREGDIGILDGLLAPQVPVDLQVAAVAALGRLDKGPVAERLLARWAGAGPALHSAILDTLCSRWEWTQALLGRLESDHGMQAEIDAAHRSSLTHNGDAKIAYRADNIFSAGIDRNRQEVIDRYLVAEGPLAGHPERGKAVFTNVCSVCHRLEGVGRVVGPDLTSLSDRSRVYLTTHILDPNRAIESRYVLYTATTNDGRSLAGMLAGEAGNSISFIGLDGVQQQLLRSELKTLTWTGRSPMPDGLEGVVNPQDMADLVSFIAGARSSELGPKQAP